MAGDEGGVRARKKGSKDESKVSSVELVKFFKVIGAGGLDPYF